MDRRVRRTREAIETAFLGLLAETRYEQISVDAVCRLANVGRSTFYAHYSGKDDLKVKGFEKHLEGLLQQAVNFENHENPDMSGAAKLHFALPIFRHAQHHRCIFKVMSESTGASLSKDAIERVVTACVRKELIAHQGQTEMPVELKVRFIVGAFLSILDWSLQSDVSMSPEQLDANFRDMVLFGAKFDQVTDCELSGNNPSMPIGGK